LVTTGASDPGEREVRLITDAAQVAAQPKAKMDIQASENWAQIMQF